ncbi:ATP-binding cassette domain-containing protein [Flavobacterium rhizosphaerae]|uniref:ATP-binding cassette domain-containing protein n=1 Tax=Flavobacterium rhizosphaerae TaxID=3163298 RepID=A0ABW8YUQ5_9FLAO
MIELQITKKFKGNTEFEISVSMQIEKGAFVALYGESGSGKTSVLRMLAGLLKPDSGKIIIDGITWFKAGYKKNIATGQRNIGYLLQENTLFPNMDVNGNLIYALGKGENRYFEEIIGYMGIAPLLNKRVDELSGGQQQRVALARTLLTKPDILLLDEPFTALDNSSKTSLIKAVKQLHKQYGLTIILVSHSIAEVALLSDITYVIKEGKITAKGSPNEVFAPNNNSNTITFPAEVISVNESTEVLTVLIQDKIVTLPLSKSGKAIPIEIGDILWLRADTFKVI